MRSGTEPQSNCKCQSMDMETLPARLFGELEDFINRLPCKEGHLVTVLHKAQHLFGYLPREVQQFVADRMGVSLAKVYGVVSFYTFFTMVPKGKHPISVCMGTACFVKGADKLVNALKECLALEVGQVTTDGKFSLDVLRCIGACALAPVIMVNGKVYANVTPDQIKTILEEYQ
ncbi:MAG TPA: NAD(P)H-dependent oxidoreductase subunit E [Deltaproteobacteria bacterium]|nr:NAD(P)H-dependent oxidoreductase subunit E [Deltaproteobacteria bacterium]HQB38069.1 NAD(P)H-dependent oxidoreductase subunit E [Deltaproteobacteria bacterium]